MNNLFSVPYDSLLAYKNVQTSKSLRVCLFHLSLVVYDGPNVLRKPKELYYTMKWDVGKLQLFLPLVFVHLFLKSTFSHTLNWRFSLLFSTLYTWNWKSLYLTWSEISMGNCKVLFMLMFVQKTIQMLGCCGRNFYYSGNKKIEVLRESL